MTWPDEEMPPELQLCILHFLYNADESYFPWEKNCLAFFV